MGTKHNQPKTLAVKPTIHKWIKGDAQARGMMLKDYPDFLVELAKVTTPDQQSTALTRIYEQRRRQPA